MHFISSHARKSCSCLHLLYWSRCWPFKRGFECSCSSWIAAYCGEGAWLFRPHENTIAHGFVCLLRTCKHSQASTAGHLGVHTLMPEAQNGT